MKNNTYSVIQVFASQPAEVVRENLTREEAEGLETQLSQQQPHNFFVCV
jgi:hypothetical protein